ncbi:MAG: DNA polymerase III subunit delta [Pseudomonadales bacterium]|nr:DNA polymerase III subunit delta [Pseudomonadales bacterium]
MMLQAEQLAGSFRQSPLPLYWIASDEPLLLQETADRFRTECKQQGFSERELMFVDTGFSWQTLHEAGSSMSLFADRKLIELRLRTSKPGEEGNRAILDYLQNPNPDSVVLLISPKLEAAQIKTKWFQQLEAHAGVVNIRTINAAELPTWIRQRLQQAGLAADNQAIDLLAERVEGNLLAASQEIEKLAILHAQENKTIHLDAQTIIAAVVNSSRYNVFALIDASLLGNTAGALKMLRGMATEGTEPLMLLAMLCREIRSLISMSAAVDNGQSIAASMQAARIWNNRKSCVQAALARHTTQQLQRILMRGKQVDHAVKGLIHSNPWQELTDMILLLSGCQTPATHYSLKTGS